MLHDFRIHKDMAVRLWRSSSANLCTLSWHNDKFQIGVFFLFPFFNQPSFAILPEIFLYVMGLSRLHHHFQSMPMRPQTLSDTNVSHEFFEVCELSSPAATFPGSFQHTCSPQNCLKTQSFLILTLTVRGI